ncbi:Hsp90 co-chaperone CDC37 [Choiromyces venosus 120613-1]|uniref:Hsp90 chaperone protein kinase-targeting subunit n=1 Tax=Choiromyces venosus 120613-1 TaxID=1336337 RepID=A0A3N4JNM4_9PEZI|nr:Hsp90 co-chaperone CDC37 [Choiromyces venosus 120613-1]
MPLDYSKWDKYVPITNIDKCSFINAKWQEIHEQHSMRKQQITNLCIEYSMNEVLLGSKTSRSPEEIVQMMASLVDSIKKEIDAEKPDDRWTAFLNKLKERKDKLTGVYNDSGKRLADLEKEDNVKIASDSIHVGFSTGPVTKEALFPKKEPAKRMQKVQAVEQLNRCVKVKDLLALDSSSGTDANVEEGGDEADEDHIEPTVLGKEFSHIKLGNYHMEFISHNPAVVTEKETDGLLIEAFNSQIAGKEDYTKQSLFFKRITTPNHQAQKVFHEDVTTTYGHIRERAMAIANECSNKNTEQTQLHAIDPNTQISITIPSADSKEPDIQKSHKIFESFPLRLQRVLESGSLDEVNKVLGKIQVLKKIEEEERTVKANASNSLGVMEMDRKVSGKGKGKEETPKDEDLAKEID